MPNLIQLLQPVHHRLKIPWQRRFPGERVAAAGVGYPQAPGVEKLAVHQAFKTCEPWVARQAAHPAPVGIFWRAVGWRPTSFAIRPSIAARCPQTRA